MDDQRHFGWCFGPGRLVFPIVAALLVHGPTASAGTGIVRGSQQFQSRLSAKSAELDRERRRFYVQNDEHSGLHKEPRF
jgi:hypothetical protein